VGLSVVVPAYNRPDVLAVCLRCLATQTLASQEYEVVVVDDGSEEDLEPVVRGVAEAMRVRLIRLLHNLGRAAARNRGIEVARGEVIVFIDSDVFAPPGFLEAHRNVHARNERAVGRGPLLLTEHLEDPFTRPPVLQDPSPAFLDTANASVRRAHLLAAGGFDEGFRHYGWEDLDLGIRLKRMGLRRVFSRRALAYHYQPLPSAKTLTDLLRKEEERARMAVRFLRKHPGWRTRLAVQLTPLHQVLAYVMTGGGAVGPQNVAAVVDRVRRALGPSGAYLLVRGVLNRHYLRTLRHEWTRSLAPH
jgi:GT2 family glycosyltransferase